MRLPWLSPQSPIPPLTSVELRAGSSQAKYLWAKGNLCKPSPTYEGSKTMPSAEIIRELQEINYPILGVDLLGHFPLLPAPLLSERLDIFLFGSPLQRFISNAPRLRVSASPRHPR